MQEKAWELGGEMSGKRRPENSLLEVDAEWDTARPAAPEVSFCLQTEIPQTGTLPSPFSLSWFYSGGTTCLQQVAVERTTSLEDMIKQRILDDRWDSIIPKRAPRSTATSDTPELSHEKSNIGLGELYEKVPSAPLSPPPLLPLGTSIAHRPQHRFAVLCRSISTPHLACPAMMATRERESSRANYLQRFAEKSTRCPTSPSPHARTCPMSRSVCTDSAAASK